ADAVLDLEGNELQRGQLYYAQAIFRGSNSGLRLSAFSGSCPLYVTKASFGDPTGEPLAFFPENPNENIIREGSTLYIVFAEPTRCGESTAWTLDSRTSYVTTGGSSSTAVGPHSSRFAIYRAGGTGFNYYQFQVCPCSIGSGRPSCRMGCTGGLGLASGQNENVLTTNSNSPHNVIFVKVKEG
nr:trypsin inhibitor:ISOTYPE=a [Cyrtosperma merkusii]